MKFVISFTTSPSRIEKIKPMIDSIINQSLKPNLILLNIAEIFPRTGERYIIPDFVKNNVTINRIEKDLGPATKLIPTITYLKNNNYDENDTFIIYLDDDIRYSNNMISTYNFLLTINKTKRVLCCGGFHFANRNGNLFLCGQRKHNDLVSVAEGYASVCVALSIFKQDFEDYMHKYISSYKECLLSDDVVLSNYFLLHKIEIRIVSIPGKCSLHDIWDKKCILDYGNEDDALHCGANGFSVTNVERYPKVLKILNSNNELALQIFPFPENINFSFSK